MNRNRTHLIEKRTRVPQIAHRIGAKEFRGAGDGAHAGAALGEVNGVDVDGIGDGGADDRAQQLGEDVEWHEPPGEGAEGRKSNRHLFDQKWI